METEGNNINEIIVKEIKVTPPPKVRRSSTVSDGDFNGALVDFAQRTLGKTIPFEVFTDRKSLITEFESGDLNRIMTVSLNHNNGRLWGKISRVIYDPSDNLNKHFVLIEIPANCADCREIISTDGVFVARMLVSADGISTSLMRIIALDYITNYEEEASHENV